MPVRLFHRCVSGALDATDVASLRVLATLGVEARAPWLGVIAPALEHDDPDVRAAAIAAHAGAKGRLAFERMRAALDDRDQRVRAAAVEAMRESCIGLPGRWALVVFHGDVAVRRAALVAGTPQNGHYVALHLLADPASRALVALPDDVSTAGVILRFALRGDLEPERARAWLERMVRPELFDALLQSRWRTPLEIAPIVDGDDAGVANDDALDWLFELWAAPDVEPARARRFLRAFRAHVLPVAHQHRRVAASIVATLRRRGRLTDDEAALLGAVHPRALGDVRLPREVRVAAIEGPIACGSATPSVDAAGADALLASDLPRGEDGRLDVRALAAIATVAPPGERARVFERFAIDEIVGAFVAAPQRSAPILVHGRAAGLLDRLLSAMASRRDLVLALAIQTAPTEDVAFVLELGADSVVDATCGVEDLLASDDTGLTPQKLERLADAAAHVLASDASAAASFLVRLLDRTEPARCALLRDVLGQLSRKLDAAAWVALALRLDPPRLERLLALLPDVAAVAIGKELALASALVAHESETARRWAEDRLRRGEIAARRPSGIVDLSELARRRIAGAKTLPELLDALEPALAAPARGLTAALAGVPATPSPVVCAALLACHDDPPHVSRELARFAGTSPAELTAIDAEAVRRWQGRAGILPRLGNAWLHLFEAHAIALLAGVEAAEGGVVAALEDARHLAWAPVADAIWSGVATAFEMWSRRSPARLVAHASDRLLDMAVAELAWDFGDAAARMLAAIAASGFAEVAIAKRRQAIIDALPDLPSKVRERLSGIVDPSGVAPAARAPRTRATEDEIAEIERARRLTDLDALATLCESSSEWIVYEAVLRLLEHGRAAGEQRLLAILARDVPPPEVLTLADAVSLCESREAHEAALELVRARRGAAARADLRFALVIALASLGNTDLAAEALAAACEGPAGWLRAKDVDRLATLVADPLVLARALARSPHPHAYERAVRFLVARQEPSPEDLAAVRAFLEAGIERRVDLRDDAARWLLAHGDFTGAPILIARALTRDGALPPKLLWHPPDGVVDALATGAVVAGGTAAVELRAVELISRITSLAGERDTGLRRVLEDGTHEIARKRARAALVPSRGRDRKLREIAEVFAWGTLRGRELTGKMLRFHITDGGKLGYATMQSGDVHVTPLPLFRGERHGREIVEALVLHEIGHHVWHSSPEALEIWKRAQDMGLVRLLNLVMDEHLERNLRAREPEWGDRLKTLAAWAFHHSHNDIPIGMLLLTLGLRSFDVLSRVKLGVGSTPWNIRVESGAVLAELSSGGHSFASFVRALRMGLGDRAGDPRVREALALFDKSFRHMTVPELFEVTLKLHRMFGAEIDLVLGIGGAESVADKDGLLESDEGIEDSDVQREVRRILEAPKSSGGVATGRGGLVVNVGPDEQFSPITAIEVVPPDAAAHAKVAAGVRRHAVRIRRHLEELGVRHEPQRMRLTGRRVDATRLRALVTRNDPRALVAREVRFRTDLFLGLAIDCSGSMYGPSMERAHAFGVLLAEAARGLRSVDLRAFGFTDRTIYDAGDAQRSAITSLRATDGNNDAAALWHVAQLARRSRRRAKLIVMISDGLPTECSVSALRACVTDVGRMGIACAQVAVRPLSEVCFPHYVVIEGGELDAAVARFGAVVTKLVRAVMR